MTLTRGIYAGNMATQYIYETCRYMRIAGLRALFEFIMRYLIVSAVHNHRPDLLESPHKSLLAPSIFHIHDL